ncbi:tRNA (adenosine(37)-N6)-dimethylallyltransferase MiaA [Paracidobacterium acidisoli]|uniref:tRNA dimethylallyltransferase n=1 Tax=Paracidobacterium acidisoli TaxID=2303751 RepID=A0A372INW6_9BACT|nr:tRNA (adenosine(37)-N6)-dimethylallyltransferase MiaA [Paracidobacterium acidisoli]MBT9331928.1 tRNA (adenosine(37)-N6)-dimethylallyltransferase MiaA [Paracidobacterium acidisoli]
MDRPLVVLLGPTASGKTALSLNLARHFNGEIVSCDSVAVYREMENGTAKPTLAERQSVPHHLIDIYAPDEHSTAGDYSRLAREAIADITSRGRLPVVTGGTGLYLRALLDGLFAGPQRSVEIRFRLQHSAERRGAGWLHRLLMRLDAKAAQRIHANDTPKLIRAIEVCLAGREPITEAWQAGRDPLTGYRILRIGLNPPRRQLYERINTRAAQMFSAEFSGGLIEETRSLVARYGDAPRAFDSLGYRQARAVLRGELSLSDAISHAQQGHRNYAKRQLTWFRKEPDVHWFQGFGDNLLIAGQIMEWLASELEAPDSSPA